jgi:hypothetical protein
VKPAIAEGAWREGRTSEAVELSTSVFAEAGENEEEEDKRDKMRAQISFYASTPTYRTVLEAHGWAEVGEKLGRLARARGETRYPPSSPTICSTPSRFRPPQAGWETP